MTKKELRTKNPNNPYQRSYSEAVRRGSKIQQVIPRKNEWVVKRISSDKPSAVVSTRDLAISKACKIARNQRTEVIVHSKNGRISRRISCGTK